MRIQLRTPALRFDEDEYDVADLVLLALAEGSWQRLERHLARGLALEREHGRAVDEARVVAALRRYRYDELMARRGLYFHLTSQQLPE